MLDKIKGGLFGVAVGDALGSGVEFHRPDAIKRKFGYVTEIMGGGMFGFLKGEVTDDTEMTLCVAKGILKNPFFPIEYIGEEFVEWMETNPKDCGMTIRYAVNAFYRTQNWEEAAKETHDYLDGKSAGNGTLMRTLPISLAYKKVELIEEHSKNQSKLTHHDEAAADICVIYNRIAHRLLNGEDLREAIASEVKGTAYESAISTKPNCEPDAYVVHTFLWTIYILLHTSSYEEAIQTAVNLGYDADTTAAVVGGLAGIYYGFNTIPERYVDALLKKDEIDHVANELYEFRKKQTD